MNKIIHILLVFLLMLSSAFSHAQQTIRQRDPAQKYQIGQELFLKSLYGGAREQFEAFIQESPNHLLASNAEYYVGLCALYQGQP
ncbi:MAG: Outer rane lipoprotein, partial [Cytophagaceae bacterium]|nr:Outer rane lipoprotein [Cytophagaceae bacterium]